MANEKRLIDANKAQAVLVNMAEHLLEAGNPEMGGAVGYAAEVIGKQKTVDAVEVVRCRDCKYFSRDAEYNRAWCNFYTGCIETAVNGYCYHGAKMDGGNEDA